MKSSIGHIILNVKDFPISEKFYDELMQKLGFRIDHQDENEECILKSYMCSEHNLWIRFSKVDESKNFVRNVGLDHLAFLVESKTNVVETYELIKKLNVKITRKPKAYPEYTETYFAFFFRDPNEIPLEIYYSK